MSLETKRREFTRLFEGEDVSLQNLKDYFTKYPEVMRHPRGSPEFLRERAELNHIPFAKHISKNIGRYRSILDNGVSLQREINALEQQASATEHLTHNNEERREYNGRWFTLPTPFRHMKSLINPKNTKDNYSFIWSILASIHQESILRDRTRVYKYVKFWDMYDWSMFSTGDVLDNLQEFERVNNIAVFIVAPEEGVLENGVYNVHYRPSIRLKEANHIVYLAHFRGDRYTAVVNYRAFFNLKDEKLKPYICLKCGKKHKSMESFHEHYDEVCRHN